MLGLLCIPTPYMKRSASIEWEKIGIWKIPMGKKRAYAGQVIFPESDKDPEERGKAKWGELWVNSIGARPL
jgi:hypothetical protein